MGIVVKGFTVNPQILSQVIFYTGPHAGISIFNAASPLEFTTLVHD